jgi:hypothetical protein
MMTPPKYMLIGVAVLIVKFCIKLCVWCGVEIGIFLKVLIVKY